MGAVLPGLEGPAEPGVCSLWEAVKGHHSVSSTGGHCCPLVCAVGEPDSPPSGPYEVVISIYLIVKVLGLLLLKLKCLLGASFKLLFFFFSFFLFPGDKLHSMRNS